MSNLSSNTVCNKAYKSNSLPHIGQKQYFIFKIFYKEAKRIQIQLHVAPVDIYRIHNSQLLFYLKLASNPPTRRHGYK